MAFKINNTTIMDTTGINVPTFVSSGRPASPVTGQVIYNTQTNFLEIYDQGVWKDVTQNVSGGAFLYRQIISTGYVLGGYKNTSPWKNVNRMVHSTDVMTNLGDLLSYAGVYTSGVNSLTRGFLWSADDSWPGTSAQTVAINLATETNAGINSAWNMSTGRNDCGTCFKEHLYAYITGGGSGTLDLFNLTTETMTVGATSPGVAGDEQGGVTAINDETVGYFLSTSARKINFANATSYTITTPGGGANQTSGQQKGINTKLGRGYFGNEGTYNGGYNLRRYVIPTETYTTVAKPIGDSGEENFDMGQAWQYMMGMYATEGQNNRGWKFSYSTDSGFELGAGSIRTGVPGGSSGHCVWK